MPIATTRVIRGRSLLIAALACAGCAQKPPAPHVTALSPDLVIIARVGSAQTQPHPPDCPLQTFDRMPAGVIRDLGSIDLAGSVPVGTDIFIAVNQKACESGADAIVVAQREQRNLADKTEYRIVAEAILMHANAGSSRPAPSGPKESLMQPVTGDSSDEAAEIPPSSAMSESSIAPTEAAPLSPAGVPAASASPSPTPSPALAVSTDIPASASTPIATAMS